MFYYIRRIIYKKVSPGIRLKKCQIYGGIKVVDIETEMDENYKGNSEVFVLGIKRFRWLLYKALII